MVIIVDSLNIKTSKWWNWTVTFLSSSEVSNSI